MRRYRDQAIVLGHHALGEADRIVVMLSRGHGQVRAVAKGVRRTRSRFGARLEPFTLVDVELHPGRSLEIVTGADLIEPFGTWIAADYPSYTAAKVMAETAGRLTEEDSSTRPQYLLLLAALRSLSRREHDPVLAADAYLLRALSVAGWAPSFAQCSQCGAPGPHQSFVPDMGGVVCPACRPPGAMNLGPEGVELLSALLTGDWAVADAAGDRARRHADAAVRAYLQWHLEHRLKSLGQLERA